MILHASMMDMVPTMIMMLKVCNTYHKCIYIYICVCVCVHEKSFANRLYLQYFS